MNVNELCAIPFASPSKLDARRRVRIGRLTDSDESHRAESTRWRPFVAVARSIPRPNSRSRANERKINLGSRNLDGQDIVISRMPFNLSGLFKDALGVSIASLPNGYAAWVKVTSGPVDNVSVDTFGTGYRTGMAWGDDTFRATEYNGGSICFVPQTFAISVTAQDVAGTTPGNRRSYQRDIAFQRQQGSVNGQLTASGKNVAGATIAVLTSNWGVQGNVGKIATTSAATSGSNFVLPTITCDQVRLRITPPNAPAIERTVILAPCGEVIMGVDTMSTCKNLAIDY